MSDHILDDHRRAMEEAFFAKQEAELLRRLRGDADDAGANAALAAATGVSDEAALARLRELGVRPAEAAALTLYPMAAVAWADGGFSEAERAIATQAAEAAGIQPGSPAFDLLRQWFSAAPSPAMAEAWRGYARALAAQLPAGDRRRLADDTLSRARALADSSGGFFGFGRRISSAEERVLSDLQAAFEG